MLEIFHGISLRIKNFFTDCKVSSIRFGMDKETGEFRGYAHVDFSDSISLTMALKLDQKVECGRPARISCAVPLKKAQINTRSVPRTIDIAPMSTETANANDVSTPVVSTGKMKRSCYECGEKGHISSDYPKKQTAGLVDATADCSKEQTAPTTTDSAFTTTRMDNTNGGSTSVVSTGKMKRRSCYECGEKGYIADCSKEQTAPTTTDSALTATTIADANGGSTSVISTSKMKRKSCFECGEKGHICFHCPKKQMASLIDATADCPKDHTDLKTTESSPTTAKRADTNSESISVVSAGKVKRTCYECGGKGHISSDCPKKQTATSTNATAD